jgi:hypothetical protein
VAHYRCGQTVAHIFDKQTGVNMIIFKGKKVVDLEITGVDSKDYPDFADAHFASACYSDGTSLTDQELTELEYLYGDLLWEMAFDSLH